MRGIAVEAVGGSRARVISCVDRAGGALFCLDSAAMRLAHVRERHAPAGAPFRLAAALDKQGRQWLDLEPARRRAAANDERLAHNSVLFRQPITTLDAHLARGLRVEALSEVVELVGPGIDPDDDAVMEAGDLDFGPPILRPGSLRDFYAFERHVATMWKRRDLPVPEAWYRLPDLLLQQRV